MKTMILAVVVVLALAGCGGEDESGQPVPDSHGPAPVALPAGVSDLVVYTSNAVVCLPGGAATLTAEGLAPDVPPYTLARCTWTCVTVGGVTYPTLAVTFERETPERLWVPIAFTVAPGTCN